MNQNNLTIKSQEALQASQQIAQSNGQQSIEPAHLLKGILEVDENVIPFIFKKNNIKIDKLIDELNILISSYPKVDGGEVYLSQETNKIFQQSTAIAKEMKDEFVSLEHLFLAILKSKDKISSLLKNEGLNEKQVMSAIAQLRKGFALCSRRSWNKELSAGRADAVGGREPPG